MVEVRDDLSTEPVDGAPPGERRIRLYRTRAIVLRRRDTGEADRILTVLTDEYGRRRLVAKGVRRPGSRLAGHLEPCCVTNILVAKTRGLDIVSQAEAIEAFANLRADEAAIATASQLGELVDLLLPEDERHPGVFDLMESALRLLDRGRDRQIVLYVFEMGLLRLLGYRPQLDPCVVCGTPLQPEPNGLSPDGGVVCRRCAERGTGVVPLNVSALKVLRAIDRGEIERVLQLHLRQDVRDEIDEALTRYVSRIVGKEPASLRVVRDLRLE